MPRNAKKGEWSENKMCVAEAMAEGTKTQSEIAIEFNIQDSTISRWKREPVFIEKIDELTLKLERHSLAGMLRRIDSKQKETTVKKDEWTKLEEMKSKLLGYDKKKIDIEVAPIPLTKVDIDEALAKKFGDWLAVQNTTEEE